MKAASECIPCYLKQCISTLRIAGVEEKDIPQHLYGVFGTIASLDTGATPGRNSSRVLHTLYGQLGDSDPYRRLKSDWNGYILERLDHLESILDRARDRLLCAFKISVAGNVIDMGITPDFDIDFAMAEITGKEFDLSDYDDFSRRLSSAHSVLILGDNCGEIVFDRFLTEELVKRGLDVAYAVKEEPVLNDATMADAVQAGLPDICRVIASGGKYLGMEMDRCTPDFLTLYKKADIVISKGQANFESLEGSSFAGDKTFFVLRAKCPLVADTIGVPLGSIVLCRNRCRNDKNGDPI